MTISRRIILVGLAAVPGLARPAEAGQPRPYDANAFDSAVETGSPVVVHVTASWCGECKQQKPIVKRLAEQPDFLRLIIFEVDFDTQKEAVHRLRVQKQSTLLAFKGNKEVARLVGDTRPEAIEALMRKAL